MFIYIAIFVVIYNLTKAFIRSGIIKNLLIIFASLLVLLTVVNEHSLIVLSVISLLVYFIGIGLQKKHSAILLSAMLLFVVGLFSIRNYPFIQNILSESYFSFINEPVVSVQKLGISYILFRYVHWLVESYRNTIYRSNPLTFLNYIFFFPNFLAGPIDTYHNFHYWLGNTRFKYLRPLFFAGISRIFTGGVKTLLIVPLVIDYALDYTVLLPWFSPGAALFLSLLAYSAYIYFDFSGYSDIAIGTAYLIGIKTPENFNNPYFSSNLSVFWRRWHITFSRFLFAYVFKPVLVLYNKMFPRFPRIVITISGYMTTFFICGLWHGETINFVYWGLWHGLGISIGKLWQLYVPVAEKVKNGVIYRSISILITFIFVTFGWMFFHYGSEELMQIFNTVIF
ncbi:MAG: MBOAT family O-acyltransferase [Bacteroidales bacterium]|nr:MBOAT family O-acyltransferase [Bacteroidales bacterium]